MVFLFETSDSAPLRSVLVSSISSNPTVSTSFASAPDISLVFDNALLACSFFNSRSSHKLIKRFMSALLLSRKFILEFNEWFNNGIDNSVGFVMVLPPVGWRPDVIFPQTVFNKLLAFVDLELAPLISKTRVSNKTVSVIF